MLQLEKEVENKKIIIKNAFFFVFEFIQVFRGSPSGVKFRHSKKWRQRLIDLKSTTGNFKEQKSVNKPTEWKPTSNKLKFTKKNL